MLQTLTLSLLVATSLATQVASQPLIRLGDGARQLSEQDIDRVQAFLPAGTRPWLLSGDIDPYLPIPQVEAYLPPITEAARLRRGRVITVYRPPNSQTWSLSSDSAIYAQVGITGRAFDQIPGDQDANRPFRVVGSVDDAELVSIVDFVRSSLQADGPIGVVSRQADGSFGS